MSSQNENGIRWRPGKNSYAGSLMRDGETIATAGKTVDIVKGRLNWKAKFRRWTPLPYPGAGFLKPPRFVGDWTPFEDDSEDDSTDSESIVRMDISQKVVTSPLLL